MTILGITLFMLLVLMIGKGSKEFGLKQFLILALITLGQVCVAVIEMVTKPIPPYQ
jgi:hypothetical protein